MHNTHAILEFLLFTKYWFRQITSVLFVAIRKNVVRINGTSLFDFLNKVGRLDSGLFTYLGCYFLNF
jgi:hypothetical protein